MIGYQTDDVGANLVFALEQTDDVGANLVQAGRNNVPV